MQGRIEMMTHKAVSFRMKVNLGGGKRGEVKRSISLRDVEFIEFGPLENERLLLKQKQHEAPAALRELWDQKVGYLGQPRSNTGEVGLLLARVLLRMDSTYHWKDAMELYDLIERKSWKEEDRRNARIGRMRGMVVQGKLSEAVKLANMEIGKDDDEQTVIESHLMLGEIGLRNLKALQEKHPRWQDDDEVRPQRHRIYHQAVDHYLDAHLFHGTWNESAVRGLMGAVAVYLFAEQEDKARECLEDVVQIYPGTSLASQAAEQLKIYNDNEKQTTK